MTQGVGNYNSRGRGWAVLKFSMLKVDFLKRAALYGAVLSVSGCTVLYYLIQSTA